MTLEEIARENPEMDLVARILDKKCRLFEEKLLCLGVDGLAVK